MKKTRIFTLILTVFLINLLAGCDNISAKLIEGKDTHLAVASIQTGSEINLEENIAIHYIDVGQADSILIQQGDESLLIDAGNNDDSDLVVDYIKKQGIKKLDYVVGTHPHEDHIGGLDAVINKYTIGKVIMPKVTSKTKTFKDVIAAIKAKDLKITTAKVGDKFNVGSAQCQILAPNSSKYDNLNDYSVTIGITYGDSSYLFTGDAEVKSEKEIIKNGLLQHFDVLKVGHHGSKSSSCTKFLDIVKPKYAIISCGKDNDYGHPNKETLDKLNERGIQILRTDEIGTIILHSDGKEISFYSDEGKVQEIEAGGNQEQDSNIASNIKIIDVDKVKEVVTIKNSTDKDVLMTGWKLKSIKGNQVFSFPKDYKIKSSAVIKISSGSEKGDLDWGQKNVWNNTSADPAELYNGEGELIDKAS